MPVFRSYISGLFVVVLGVGVWGFCSSFLSLIWVWFIERCSDENDSLRGRLQKWRKVMMMKCKLRVVVPRESRLKNRDRVGLEVVRWHRFCSCSSDVTALRSKDRLRCWWGIDRWGLGMLPPSCPGMSPRSWCCWSWPRVFSNLEDKAAEMSMLVCCCLQWECEVLRDRNRTPTQRVRC